MIEGIIIGLVVLGIQLAFIDKIIRKRNQQREQRLWTPFRILFFQAICDHHVQLMQIYSGLVDGLESSLSEIYKKRHVHDSDIKNILAQLAEYQATLSDSDKSFHNVIQTVSASLQPEAADHCNESLYFSYILNKYMNEVKFICIDMLKIDNLNDRDKTSHPLNGIYAKKLALEMIVETRLKGFVERFSSSIWRTEGLYYHKGEIMGEEDYRSALRSERSVNELSKIPRTLPVKNFFDP